VNKRGLPVWKLALSKFALEESTCNESSGNRDAAVAPFFFFNSSFQKCRLKIGNREWKMFHGELSAAVNKY
jgi:hypothetical protein